MNDTGFKTLDEAYANYEKFCKEKELALATKEMFEKIMKELGVDFAKHDQNS
jgi:hypothetical protein